jgi:hypothetical protein
VSEWRPHGKPHDRDETHKEECKVKSHVHIFLKQEVNRNVSAFLIEEDNVKAASFPVFNQDVMEHCSNEEAASSVLRSYNNDDN